ncbi:DUF2227 family putative metal-binding protein [Deinococcus ficus]|uniref:Hydrolase n=1 Tax=Deinococcus ficus TaxID=317577 RepID=A0A221T2U3_9DEIO|nr:DUF2227 family putative metal-binding protein [Deinococcus ficus]ASN83181.1 hypothetical protein DFI_18445 [Deinococcus ficus]
MPSGRTHSLINFSVLGAGMMLWQVLGRPADDTPGLSVAAGMIIGTVWITPDLDMRGVKVDAQRAWGPLGAVWSPLRMLSKHRGVSHTYLRGPLLRVAYLAAIAALLLLLVRLCTGTPWNSPLPSLPVHLSTAPPVKVLLWSYCGYHAAQVLHLIADRIPLSFKRL